MKKVREKKIEEDGSGKRTDEKERGEKKIIREREGLDNGDKERETTPPPPPPPPEGWRRWRWKRKKGVGLEVEENKQGVVVERKRKGGSG